MGMDLAEVVTMLRFSVADYRHHGQPKIKKPKELRGIKQSFSVEYIPKKARCQVFLHKGDVWVRHVDYFSPELASGSLSGAPLNVWRDKYLSRVGRAKFTYEDSWGSVVLRCEAWLRVLGLIKAATSGFPPSVTAELLRQQEVWHNFEPLSLLCSDMERFWETVVMKIKKGVGKW